MRRFYDLHGHWHAKRQGKQVSTGTFNQESGDLRPILDGPAKREIN
jgi:hypothetical protein